VKNEIRDFLDVRVGKAYKCPQRNTMKLLVHESLSLEGFAHGQGCRCTTTKLDCLMGSFVKK